MAWGWWACCEKAQAQAGAERSWARAEAEAERSWARAGAAQSWVEAGAEAERSWARAGAGAGSWTLRERGREQEPA